MPGVPRMHGPSLAEVAQEMHLVQDLIVGVLCNMPWRPEKSAADALVLAAVLDAGWSVMEATPGAPDCLRCETTVTARASDLLDALRERQPRPLSPDAKHSWRPGRRVTDAYEALIDEVSWRREIIASLHDEPED